MSVHSPKNQSLSVLDFEILKLNSNQSIRWKSTQLEVVAVLIEGACTISSRNETWDMQRRSVFDDPAAAVFASPGEELVIRASKSTTVALCKARADKKFSTTFISPTKIHPEWRGTTGFRRRVFNIVNAETQTQRIAVGETINEPGEWSSFPPHKHDEYIKNGDTTVEVPLEELYYFRIQPTTGFGFQRLYTKDGSFDEGYVIRDGDITQIPRGYHPVANIPGHQLYYLWMLAGKERTYIWHTDPEFKWLEKK